MITVAVSEDLRYPIGEFDADFDFNEESREAFINTIESLPGEIRRTVEGLNDLQIDTEYRPEGWTVRQVVHHVADSHMNAFCRFKLALTEDFPTIRPYDEAAWAKLEDSRLPVEISLKLIEGIHSRWAEILKRMNFDDFERKLNHPESGVWTLGKMLGLYEWHSKHRTAHITSLIERKGW